MIVTTRRYSPFSGLGCVCSFAYINDAIYNGRQHICNFFPLFRLQSYNFSPINPSTFCNFLPIKAFSTGRGNLSIVHYNDGVIISLQELSFSVRAIYPFSVRSRNCLFTAVRLIPAASASCGMVLYGCSYIRYLQKITLKGLCHQPLSGAKLQKSIKKQQCNT